MADKPPKRVLFTTFVVGSDGQIYDWEKRRFSIRENAKGEKGYYPVNAYTAPVEVEEE